MRHSIVTVVLSLLFCSCAYGSHANGKEWSCHENKNPVNFSIWTQSVDLVLLIDHDGKDTLEGCCNDANNDNDESRLRHM